MGIFDSDSHFSRFKARTGMRIAKSTDLKSYIAFQDSKKRAFRIIEGLYKTKGEDVIIELKDRVEKAIRKHYHDLFVEDEDLLELINEAVKKTKIK
jgi:hypothetical protein